MRRIDGTAGLSPAHFRRPAVSIGVFDGVHRGHRHVLEQLRALADRDGGEAVVVTFDTHPQAILAGSAPTPILSLRHRLLLLDRLGVDATVVLPFDEAVRDTPYERFVEEVLVRGLGIRSLLFGYNTNFGKGGLGTFATVAPLAARLHFAVHEAPPIGVHGRPISATRIRQAIESGDLAEANELLGRPHALVGTVVRGDGRGRTLGFPTANVDLEGELLPPPGVYQVVAEIRRKRYVAVANIGLRPTFPGARPPRPLLEVHIPGIDFEFYGDSIEVELVRKIRDEIRFPSREALIDRIREDVASLGLVSPLRSSPSPVRSVESAPMPDPTPGLTLTVKPNGPVLVPGPLTLVDPTGKAHVTPAGKMIALCRCGQSAMKPYCDGSHSRTGFQAAGEAPPR